MHTFTATTFGFFADSLSSGADSTFVAADSTFCADNTVFDCVFYGMKRMRVLYVGLDRVVQCRQLQLNNSRNVSY